MSRPLRIQFPDAWYHVMNRGRRRENIYLDNSDYNNFLELIKDASEMWHVNISAFCLMPNHYHMQVHTPLGNLSRFMRHVDGVYTQTFNKRHGVDGSLFKGRFKSILVEADDHLLQLVRYIHRNPIRGKIVESLNEYPWSSHFGYVSNKNEWDWIYKDFILGIFSDDNSERKKMYIDFVSLEDTQELVDTMENPRWPVLWGSNAFVDRIKKIFFRKKVHKEIPESSILVPDVAGVIRVVCDHYKIEEVELKKSRRGLNNEPRNVAIYLIRVLRGDTLEEIGAAFGLNRFSSVSSVIQKLKFKFDKDEMLKKRIDEIKNDILKSQT